jgi:protease I
MEVRTMAKKVAVLLGPEFEDSEFQIPYERLKKEGFQVDVIGAEAGQELKGHKGKVTAHADKSIADARPGDYDALVLPGGHSPDRLRADQRFVRFVKEFDASKKLLAAVCHGPQLLISAGLVKGRTLTAWSTIQEDLRQIGAKVKDEPLVRDSNWITSRKPEDLQQFSDAIVQALR